MKNNFTGFGSLILLAGGLLLVGCASPEREGGVRFKVGNLNESPSTHPMVIDHRTQPDDMTNIDS